MSPSASTENQCSPDGRGDEYQALTKCCCLLCLAHGLTVKLQGCARSGFEIDQVWKGGKLVIAAIKSVGSEDCKVSCAGKVVDLKVKRNNIVKLNANLEQA